MKDFVVSLKEDIEGYDGKYANIIREAPSIYLLMTNLLTFPDMKQGLRFKLFGAIGYFIIPQDLYPEDIHGPIGYIDDIILSLYVLRQIEDEYNFEDFFPYWNGSQERLKSLMHEDYEILITENDRLFAELLDYSGF